MPTLFDSLKSRHPDHIANSQRWELLRCMVAGGSKMDATKKRLILANPDGRPENVMSERVKLATYNNKIGPILSRFNSQLFSDPVSFTGSGDPFWAQFDKGGALLEGDDDGRADFKTFLARAMQDAMASGKAIAQVDVRRSDTSPLSRLDQKQSGALEPYVLLHPREALWDWKSDGQGFLFAKLHAYRDYRPRWDLPSIPEHDFTIYQREDDGRILAWRYLVRKIKNTGTKPTYFNLDNAAKDDVEIIPVLEAAEIFNFNGKFIFPIATLTLPDDLWIGEQMFESQKSYFNQTSALEWGLYTSNYAMPIVSGVDDPDDDPLQGQKFGDGYYLTLKSGQSLQWTERGGSAFQISLNYRNEIKRDIYDTLQQIAMSAADGTAIIARSGESKKEDRRPEQLLLGSYGQLIKIFAKQVRDCAAIAHGEDIDWEVLGFDDFLGEGLIEDINDFAGVKSLSIPSETFVKESAKHFVKKASKAFDFDSEIVEKSLAELDKSSLKDYAPPAPPGEEVGASPPPPQQQEEADDLSPDSDDEFSGLADNFANSWEDEDE